MKEAKRGKRLEKVVRENENKKEGEWWYRKKRKKEWINPNDPLVQERLRKNERWKEGQWKSQSCPDTAEGEDEQKLTSTSKKP